MRGKSHLGDYDDVSRGYTQTIANPWTGDPLRSWSAAYPIRELTVIAEGVARKPDQFAAMLRAMADEIERLALFERKDRTPFLIDGITADPITGVLTVYFHDNE